MEKELMLGGWQGPRKLMSGPERPDIRQSLVKRKGEAFQEADLAQAKPLNRFKNGVRSCPEQPSLWDYTVSHSHEQKPASPHFPSSRSHMPR